MRWGLKGEALLPPSSNNIRRRKDARLKRGQIPQAEKTKNVSQKALLELQRYNQTKVNPRW